MTNENDPSIHCTRMQAAVDIVNNSPHPTNKVAAALFGAGGAFALARTNDWPPAILEHFGSDTDIGNSSGTIHAEVACFLSAPGPTEGGALYVTDPPCPNCAKNMAEAGMTAVYIDHKGFDKDFAARRGAQFEDMSMQIFARAGIGVYEVRRKEQTITPIQTAAPDYAPPNDSPVILSLIHCPIDDTADAAFMDMIADARANMRGDNFALALSLTRDNHSAALTARAHLAIGYSTRIDAPELHDDHGKYTFILEPANRILMNAARLGLRLSPQHFHTEQVPTARELVNLVGAGMKTLHIGNPGAARDEGALKALDQLEKACIIKVIQ